jgi:energy-coupling factor transport system permease protein
MEARGYRGGEGRTKYRILNWHLRDTASLVSLVVVTGLLLYLRK